MNPFTYLIPKSLAEACSLISEYKGTAKIIAGGQSMIPQLKLRLLNPEVVIEIKHLRGLEYIKKGRASLKIGSLTTHRAIETSILVNQKFPMVVEMERRLADVQIRNWGTIGGNLCHADPAGDPAPVLIALGAKASMMSAKGNRKIPLEKFFVDFMTTVLEPDEILTEIEIPYLPPYTAGAYYKETVRVTDLPIASVAAVIGLDERRKQVKEARIVLGGVGSTPIRAKEAEKLLVGRKVEGESLDEVGAIAAKEARPTTDIHGSAEYKRILVSVLTKEMVNLAIKRVIAG